MLVVSLLIVIVICIIVILYLLFLKKCTLSRYLFVNHIFGLLTGPRREFFKTIFDSAHEINELLQDKYIFPMFEDTLDYNLQLLLDGIDWSLLNETVVKNKDCVVEFLKSDQTANSMNQLKKCYSSIKVEDVMDMERTISKNIKNNLEKFKFIKYDKLPPRVRRGKTKDAYYSDIRNTKLLMKWWANNYRSKDAYYSDSRTWANNEEPNNLVTEEIF